MINFDEKTLLLNNPYVMEELNTFLQQYNTEKEELFYIYLLSKAQKDFLFFCKLFYPYVATGNANLIIHQGVLIMCEILQLDFERKIAQPFIINIMPRAGKTTIATILYTAFLFANSDEEIILNFTKSSFTTKDNHRYLNNILDSYLFSFYLKEKPNTKSFESFINEKSYVRSATIYTSSIGGNATLVNIDDPNDISKIDSADNSRVFNVVVDSLKKRASGLVKNVRPLRVIQQRIGINDLTGLLLSTYNNIIHIKLKEYEPDDVVIDIPLVDGSIYKIKRTAGHLINTPEVLKQIEEDKQVMPKYMALYQQEPEIAREQLIFNLDSFVFIDKNYIDNQIIKMSLLTTDLSINDEGTDNDFTCFCLWLITEDYKLILFDCFYKKLHYSVDRTELLASFYNRHSILKPMILMENAGDASFRKSQLLKNYNIKDIKIIERRGRPDISKPDTLFAGSKEIRLLNASEYVNIHKVFIKEEYKAIVLNEAKSITLQTVNKVHDDFCFVAGSKIKTINGDVEIQYIKAGDKVKTPFGIREVECCKCTGKKGVIYNKELDLIGTPTHKILDNKKHYDNLIDAKLCNSIKYNLKNLLIWKIKWNILLMVYCIKGWEEAKNKEREIISFLITKPIKKELATNLFIVLSGNITIIKKLKKVMSCTIKIITHLIIIPIIYNYLQGKSIYKDITKLARIKVKKLLKDKKNLLQFLLKKRDCGIEVKKEERKVVKCQNKQWRKQEELEYVNCVVKNMNIATYQEPKTELFVENVMMLGGIENKEQLNLVKLPVWNLKVKGGCYFANNILVSNCDNLADACVVMQLAS